MLGNQRTSRKLWVKLKVVERADISEDENDRPAFDALDGSDKVKAGVASALCCLLYL